MLRTAIAIRHIMFEDLGWFEPVLERAGYRIHYYDAGVDDLWTIDPVRTSLIVVLGGPMGVHERDRYPFLSEEVQLIRDRIACGRPLLGVCLGAQLIAHAMGARVYSGPVKEIGVSPVTISDAGRRSPLAEIGEAPVLHWHGDTFDLPDGTDLLASSATYRHQAFAAGRNVLALQFHLEAGRDVDAWIEGHADELREAGIDGETIRRDVMAAAPSMRDAATRTLTTWLAHVRE